MGRMSCGLVYPTKLQISDVEAWLQANCKGDWDLALADVAEGGRGLAKKLEIYFELPADRDQFKSLFAGFERDKLSGRTSPSGADASEPGEKKKGWLGMLRPDKGRN